MQLKPLRFKIMTSVLLIGMIPIAYAQHVKINNQSGKHIYVYADGCQHHINLGIGQAYNSANDPLHCLFSGILELTTDPSYAPGYYKDLTLTYQVKNKVLVNGKKRMVFSEKKCAQMPAITFRSRVEGGPVIPRVINIAGGDEGCQTTDIGIQPRPRQLTN
jgi:hypothetical protein